MANQEHLDLLLNQNTRHWNIWRLQNPYIKPDLSNADLREEDLSGRDLSETNLSGANLQGANLREVNLRNANLTAADLNPIKTAHEPTSVRFPASGGTEVLVKTPVDLSKANLTGANLTATDISKAKLWKTTMPNGEVESNY